MEHEDDPDIDEPYVPPAENVLGGISENKPAPEEPTLADTAEGQGVVWLIVFMSKHKLNNTDTNGIVEKKMFHYAKCKLPYIRSK